MAFRFIPTKLIVCPGQSVVNPPSECLPYDWIKNNLSKDYDLVNFDGFAIDFKQMQITAFFMKKEFEYGTVDEVNDENIKNLFFTDEYSDGWLARLMISQLLGVPLFFFCWPKDYPHSKYPQLPAPVFIFQVSLDGNTPIIKKIKQGALPELKEFILTYRRQTFPNVKSLRISKSYMECYLSTTPFPWPGDLDGVVFERNAQKVLGILEFKTHNLNSAIEDEQISRYGQQDMRRFDVLSYLQKNLSAKQKASIPLLFIVWGKKSLHKKIKIQKIDNNRVIGEVYIDSPIFTGQYSPFTEKILELCKNI